MRAWKLVRNAKGELLIMPPTGGKSGKRETDLITNVNNWNRQANLGKVSRFCDRVAMPLASAMGCADRLFAIFTWIASIGIHSKSCGLG